MLLSACKGGRGYWRPSEEDVKVMPKRVRGTADAAVMDMQRALAKYHVKVITIGQQYLISIPAACLFPEQSPNLTWGSYDVLNKTADFLKQFRKVAITVTAYTSKYMSIKREYALTLKRAQAVARYLWSQGVDARLIVAEGAGSDKPIAAYPVRGDLSPNARIEITFSDAIV